MPTTHILEPAIADFDDHDLNEHLCLRAVRSLGMRSAASRVQTFGDERAIVVDRYDRHPSGARLHQEDTCQAIGVPPAAKYQSEGGPTPERIIELIRDAVRRAVAELEITRFVDALALNWLIGGTDARRARPGWRRSTRSRAVSRTTDMYLPKLRLAMRIGGEYRVAALSGRHWRAFAEQNRLDAARRCRKALSVG